MTTKSKIKSHEESPAKRVTTLDREVHEALEMVDALPTGWHRVKPTDYSWLTPSDRRKAFRRWRKDFLEYKSMILRVYENFIERNPHLAGFHNLKKTYLDHIDYVEISGWTAFSAQPNRYFRDDKTVDDTLRLMNNGDKQIIKLRNRLLARHAKMEAQRKKAEKRARLGRVRNG